MNGYAVCYGWGGGGGWGGVVLRHICVKVIHTYTICKFDICIYIHIFHICMLQTPLFIHVGQATVLIISLPLINKGPVSRGEKKLRTLNRHLVFLTMSHCSYRLYCTRREQLN